MNTDLKKVTVLQILATGFFWMKNKAFYRIVLMSSKKQKITYSLDMELARNVKWGCCIEKLVSFLS